MSDRILVVQPCLFDMSPDVDQKRSQTLMMGGGMLFAYTMVV